MTVLTKPLKIAINPKLIDKNAFGDPSLFAKGFSNVELTPQELADRIGRGVAYTCQLRGTRRSANFVCCDVLSVDFDGTRDIMDAVKDPIVERCMTIFYTTLTHTKERHRFRIIFALPRTITSAIEMKAASRSLSLRLGGDMAATDAARIFYGSKGSKPRVFDRCIDQALLDDLIAQGMDADQKPTKTGSGLGLAITASRKGVAQNQIITAADGMKLPFKQLQKGRSVFCPFHHDENPSAFIVTSGVGINGVHCSTCDQTFWLAGSSQPVFDFFDFDKTVHVVQEYFDEHQDPGPLREVFPRDKAIREGLIRANISIDSARYLRIKSLRDGITFIKSPKGTGKTECLRSLVHERSTLLIGHRVALIKQSCKRLGLDCYLDTPGAVDRLGICLDSLTRFQHKLPNFRTVVIDESEQVLQHLFSETITSHQRETIFAIFRALLRNAGRVVALDADLGWLTFDTLTKLANDNCSSRLVRKVPPKKSHVYLNEHATGTAIQIYDSDYHMLAELKQILQRQKRAFVTSNSKRRIDNIEEAISEELAGIQTIKITSDTINADHVKAFIKNPRSEALRYDLILTSPSLGTGIDIAFEDQKTLIDVVFGFFETRITTHFDFDQQLARVRQPREVKVWISPKTFRFDTAEDVIKTELRREGMMKNCLDDYDELGAPIYLENDPLLDLASLVVSQQYASKNNLKRHFIELKRHQGAEIRNVAKDDDLYIEGHTLAMSGRRLSDQARIENLMNAKPLRKPEHDDISGRMSENEEVSDDERWSMRRNGIERFYRQMVTPQLIKQDDRAKLRQKVSRYRNLMAEPSGKSMFRKKQDAKMRFLKKSGHEAEVLQLVLESTPVRGNGEWSFSEITTQDLKAFTGIVREHKAIIENVLDLEVRSDLASKPISQLNSILALIGMRCKPGKKRRQRGSFVFPYKLDKLLFDNVAAILEKQANTDSWETLYGLHGWDRTELSDEGADTTFDLARRRRHSIKRVRVHDQPSTIVSVWE